jgi:hypothetical protein
MKTLAVFLRLGVSFGATAAVFAPQAHADDAIPPAPSSMTPGSAVDPIAIVSGAGVKVGEGTIFRPQIGIETGVVSNVFYQPDGPVTAGLLRILAEVGTGSLPSQRLSHRTSGDDQDPNTEQNTTVVNVGDFQYSADLYAAYDQYLSTNDNVQAQGGLGGGLLFRGIVNPERPVRFGFQEDFSRVIRATNFESPNDTNRDVNRLELRLNYVPTGRSLDGYLYYVNTIDVFEADSQQFANRLQNTVGVRLNWQWLPLTRVFLDVSEAYNTGIGSSEKINSYPFTALTGIQTALTLNTTINAHAGYTNGFYAAGPSYSSLTAGLQLGFRYSPLGRVQLLYDYVHQDSINANFYRDHMFQIMLEQYFVPFVLYAQGELLLRQYDGTIVMGTNGSNSAIGNTRDDVIGGVTVGMRYNFRDWIAATLSYQLQAVETDFRYNIDGRVSLDPSYVRQELLVGVRAAY